MKMKLKLKGGLLLTIGYLLSPLSWWNDLALNLPLAYLFGSFFALFSQKLFLPMTVIGYWLTNIAGLLLIHYGVRDCAANKKECIPRINLKVAFFFSIIYTLLIVLLIKAGILKFPAEYFR